MEFTVSSTELLKALMDVSKAIPAKSPLPILENFLFVLKNDNLEITASDQDITLRTNISVISSASEGSMAVPARQILDLIKTIPDQPITIKTTSDSSFDCLWQNGNSSLPFFPAEDFPEIKGTGSEAIKITFPAETFIEGLASTVYATADDEMRPTMNGVFFDIDVASTTLVASDSHKLMCYTTFDVAASEKSSFILHKKSASVLRSIIGKDVNEVVIAFDSSNLVFNFGSTMMVCRQIVGKYPKYRDVIPQNNSNILKIDRVHFLNTIRRVAVCANKASNHIKFEFKEGQVEITAQDLGFAIAAYEKINCDYSGAELTIGFKSSFLIEILSNLSCDTLIMKFADSRKSALILPDEDGSNGCKICGIIMPIMVS